jgi:hypothetical protein
MTKAHAAVARPLIFQRGGCPSRYCVSPLRRHFVAAASSPGMACTCGRRPATPLSMRALSAHRPTLLRISALAALQAGGHRFDPRYAPSLNQAVSGREEAPFGVPSCFWSGFGRLRASLEQPAEVALTQAQPHELRPGSSPSPAACCTTSSVLVAASALQLDKCSCDW